MEDDNLSTSDCINAANDSPSNLASQIMEGAVKNHYGCAMAAGGVALLSLATGGAAAPLALGIYAACQAGATGRDVYEVNMENLKVVNECSKSIVGQ